MLMLLRRRKEENSDFIVKIFNHFHPPQLDFQPLSSLCELLAFASHFSTHNWSQPTVCIYINCRKIIFIRSGSDKTQQLDENGDFADDGEGCMLNDIRFFHENEGEKTEKLIDNELSQIFILSHFPFLPFVVVNIFFSLAPLFSPILIWLFRIPTPHHAAAAPMLLIWFSDLLIQQQHQRSMSIDDEEWRPKMHRTRKIVLFSAVFCGVIPSSRSKMNQRVSLDKSQMRNRRKSVNCEQIDTVVARRKTRGRREMEMI